MSTLICGSIAYDSIMVFHDRFRNHILPEQLHILNVSFFVPEMRREYGGCAGNIAYNLKLLGGEPLIMATVGDDAAHPGVDAEIGEAEERGLAGRAQAPVGLGVDRAALLGPGVRLGAVLLLLHQDAEAVLIDLQAGLGTE